MSTMKSTIKIQVLYDETYPDGRPSTPVQWEVTGYDVEAGALKLYLLDKRIMITPWHRIRMVEVLPSSARGT